jgi:predicted RNA methylase
MDQGARGAFTQKITQPGPPLRENPEPGEYARKENIMADQKLTPEIREVLEKGTFDENGIHYKLPPKLEPKFYQKIAGILKMMDANWQKKSESHVFLRDGRPLFKAIFESGIVPDLIKRRQAFYTPRPVAEALLETTYLEGQHILEPSGGGGGLAIPAREKGGNVVCYEIDPFDVLTLRELGFKVTQADFLTVIPEPIYDIVLMNPPFTRGQDVKHVNHALRFLKPHGKLVAIVSPGFPLEQLREYAKTYGISNMEFERIEAGAFKESGTTIETRKLKIVTNGERVVNNKDEIDWRGHQLAIEIIHGEPSEKIRKFLEHKPTYEHAEKEFEKIVGASAEIRYRKIDKDEDSLLNLAIDDDLLEQIKIECLKEVISYHDEELPPPVAPAKPAKTEKAEKIPETNPATPTSPVTFTQSAEKTGKPEKKSPATAVKLPATPAVPASRPKADQLDMFSLFNQGS